MFLGPSEAEVPQQVSSMDLDRFFLWTEMTFF
jgi:hypothetical protein